MRITDLTEFYLNFQNGEISVAEYENSHPELFNHYNRFWCHDDRPYRKITPEELQRKKDYIQNVLPFIEEKFQQAGFDLTDLEIILFVGKGTSNGHVYKHNDRFVVWLPVELYSSISLVRIFVPHEIIHALHYEASPEFYFDSKTEVEDFTRQLITEGIATFLTKEIMNVPEEEALWADYISENRIAKWMTECEDRREELIAYCRDKINSEESDNAPAFFRADDPDDIFKFRAGYFIGSKLAERLYRKKELTIRQLLQTSRDEYSKSLNL